MSFALGSNDPFVARWKRFLNAQGSYDCGSASQAFDAATDTATRQFQKDNKLKVDGVVGSLTIGAAMALGFNPDGEPTISQIRQSPQLLLWIKENLGGAIQTAVAGSAYSEDWLGAMVARETGFLITRYVNQGLSPAEVHFRMKGDYGQRPGETDKQYHGFGYWQIDIGSYPDFVNSGDWQDPLKTATKAVSVLDEKRNYLLAANLNLDPDTLERATTAAYNCGQGNVVKALNKHVDVDSYTFSQNYSAEVFRFRAIYQKL
jgi:hypothetical protein